MDVYLKHASWVRRLAFELVRDASAADDLAQETWLAYLKENFDEGRPVRPWLAAVLRNRVAMRYRSKGNREGREHRVASEAATDAESTDEVVAHAEQCRRIAAKVLELSEPYRTTLLLRYYEGLSNEAIAKRRAIPSATVRTHLRRGLNLLGESLTEDEDGKVNAWVVALLPLAMPPKEIVLGKSGVPVALGVLAVVAVATAIVWGPWRIEADPVSSLELAEVEEQWPRDRSQPTTPPQEAERQTVVNEPTERVWRLMDGATREPLSRFPVRVAGSTQRTDENGDLTLPVTTSSFEVFFEGGYAVDSPQGHAGRISTPSPPKAIELPSHQDSNTVLIDVGPAIRLDFQGSVGAGVPLIARLNRIGRTSMRDDGIACPIAPVTWNEDGSAEVMFAMWPGAVRESAQLPQGQNWHLQVGDTEGFWHGHNFLTRLPMETGGTLAIPMENTSVIEGQVDFGQGAKAAGQRIVLSSMAASSTLGNGAVVDNDLRYRIPWIIAGKHRLSLHSQTHERYSKVVELEAGELLNHDIELIATKQVGPLTGVLRSQSGTFRGTVMVFITDAENTKIHRMSAHKFVGDPSDPEGTGYQKESSIHHPGIPEGDFFAHAIAFSDRVSIHSVAGKAVGQIDPVELLILDQEPRTDWLVEIRDEDTREPIERYVLEIRPAKELMRSFRATKLASETDPPKYVWSFGAAGMAWKNLEGATPLVGMSESLQFKWWVGAEGYEPKEGNELDFKKLPSGKRSTVIYLKENR